METMDKLVKQMLEIEPELVLGLEDYPNVLVYPVIATGEEHTGEIEYQVSDGPTGVRSTSYDVFRWSEVKEAVEQMDEKINLNSIANRA
jgi:hypothetical protein